MTSLRGHVEEQGFLVLNREPGRWLTAALERLHGSTPIRIRSSGGSIPISPFVETLGVCAVSVPTVNPANNQDSPKENLRLGHFFEGIEVMLAMLGQPLPDAREPGPGPSRSGRP